MTKVILILCLALAGLSPAQSVIDFWHSMGSEEETVNALAEAFNHSQQLYRVEPSYIGNYLESQTKLQLALQSKRAPVLFQAEVSLFTRLVAEDGLLDLSDLTTDLSADLVADFYPGLWHYGEVNARRYGLPWNLSTPVLFYNATALSQRGLEVPSSWESFEAVAGQLSSRQTKGFIAVAEAWTFEMMVVSRGGQLLTPEGQPNFTSPEAIEALAMLERMVRSGDALAYNLAEAPYAIVDFVRTKGMMVFASTANWPEAKRYTIAFELAAAPVPISEGAHVPLGGAQLVVLKGASEAERRGAFAFWQFLVEPENIKTWVEASYYLPVRRAALPLLEPWYAEDPNRRVALEQLEFAIPRPQVAAYSSWQRYLEEAIEKVIKGNTSVEHALEEAQQRAEAEH